MRELDLCAASLLILTQSPSGLATSDSEINKQCVQLNEANNCMKNYTRRCMTPIQRELIAFGSNSTLQMMQEYCTKGSSLRRDYLRHAKCLNDLQKSQAKEHKVCVRDLQNSLELLSSSNMNKKLQLACCTYKKFETCLSSQLEKKCGKEALQLLDNVLLRITSRLPQTMCRNYKPEQQECKLLLPKPGTLPKGTKSVSIISRLLSAYSGV